jgi:hypothetical protein
MIRAHEYKFIGNSLDSAGDIFIQRGMARLEDGRVVLLPSHK